MSMHDLRTTKGRRRRIMESFEINEISAVDSPAQKGAQMAIMKSRPAKSRFVYDGRDMQGLQFEKRPAWLPDPIVKLHRKQASKATAKWERLVSETAAADGCTRTEAMSKCRDKHPDAYAAYNSIGASGLPNDVEAELGPVSKQLPPAGNSKFAVIVNAIMLDEGVSGTEAYRLARERNPELFATMQREDLEFGKAKTECTDCEDEDEEEAAERLAEEERLRNSSKGANTMQHEFQRRAAAITKRDRCSGVEGFRRARVEHPELFKAFTADTGWTEPNLIRPTKKAAVSSFESLVNKIQVRDKCTKTEAMQKARKEHPSEFDAYQAA